MLLRVAAVGVAKTADTERLLRYGMLVGCLAPVALAMGGFFYKLGWWTTTASVAVMSATGFFVSPPLTLSHLLPRPAFLRRKACLAIATRIYHLRVRMVRVWCLVPIILWS